MQKEVSALIADRYDYSVWRCENPCWEIFIHIPGRCQCRSEHEYQYFSRWRWIWRLRFEFGDYIDRNARWRSAALTAIDNAINAIDAKHADLGASQNRFQSTIRNLSRIVENVSSARSRSRDTDFAKETVELTRAQILQQASTTILALSNQRPPRLLSLRQSQ